MRGKINPGGTLFISFEDPDTLIPEDHPMRTIKQQADAELRRMRPAFAKAYSAIGRPSIPPEQLIKALLLQALFSIRSERQLCEQINYNLLFKYFLDMAPDQRAWHPTTFTKNRERLEENGLMKRFFEGTVARAISADATSDEHFSVDGTLIQAWASMKSFRPKAERDSDKDDSDANGWADFSGQKRSNKTHESTTDPQARLMRKGWGCESTLSHTMHVLMENRNGLVMDVQVDEATHRAERTAATSMLNRFRRRHRSTPSTLGADKGYDDGQWLHDIEECFGVTPHTPPRKGKIADRSHKGQARRKARARQSTGAFQASAKARRRIEQIIGWLKDVAGLRRTRFVGRWKTQLYLYAAAAGYNLLRRTSMAASRTSG